MPERTPFLINKAFKKYLWASLLTVAATQIANIVDAAIVGNLIGDEGLAAVNLSKPLLQTVFAITCFYVASSTILTGMAIGKGDRKAADRLFTFSVAFSVLLALLFTAAGLLCFNSLSALLCQSESLRPLAEQFMRVTLYSTLPQFLMLTLNQFVTVDGNPRLVSRAVIAGNVSNIALDILFIKYFQMGIAGAATATCVMYVISILIVLPHFFRKESLHLCKTRPGDLPLGKIFSIGLPLFLSTVLLSVQYIGNNYVASRFLGDNGLIAIAVCIQLLAFSMIILNGTLRTIQPVGSILKGLDDNLGLLMLMKRGYSFMAICLAVYTAVLVLFPSQIGSILGVKDGGGLEMVRIAVPVFSLNIVFQCMLCCMLPAFQLFDRKGMALLLSISQALLPMLFFLLFRGRWIGFVTGQAVTALAIAACSLTIHRKTPGLSRFLLIPMGDRACKLDISVQPTSASLSEAISALREFLSSNGATPHTVNVAAVCTEEFINNIIRHANAGSVDLAANLKDDGVYIMIHDDGAAFNPLETINAGGNHIGLGLTLAKEFCKDIQYKYLFNQNMVRLKI